MLNDSRVIPARLYARRTLRREAREADRPHRSHAHRAGRRQLLACARSSRAQGGDRRDPGVSRAIGAIELKAEVLERGEYGDRLLAVRTG